MERLALSKDLEKVRFSIHPKANFSLTIVEGSTDGYLARVTRASFNVSRYITILFIGQNQLLSLLMDYDY